jgi:hypothetical protein
VPVRASEPVEGETAIDGSCGHQLFLNSSLSFGSWEPGGVPPFRQCVLAIAVYCYQSWHLNGINVFAEA